MNLGVVILNQPLVVKPFNVVLGGDINVPFHCKVASSPMSHFLQA